MNTAEFKILCASCGIVTPQVLSKVTGVSERTARYWLGDAPSATVDAQAALTVLTINNKIESKVKVQLKSHEEFIKILGRSTVELYTFRSDEHLKAHRREFTPISVHLMTTVRIADALRRRGHKVVIKFRA